MEKWSKSCFCLLFQGSEIGGGLGDDGEVRFEREASREVCCSPFFICSFNLELKRLGVSMQGLDGLDRLVETIAEMASVVSMEEKPGLTGQVRCTCGFCCWRYMSRKTDSD